MACPMVRPVNKSQNTKLHLKRATGVICVVFATRLYYKSLKWILCDQIWQITCNYNSLDGSHCDGTCHRMMAVLGMDGDHGDNPWKFLNRLRDQNCFSSKTIGNEEEWEIAHYDGILKLTWISILSNISDWSVHSGIWFSFDLDFYGEYR